MSPMSNCFRFPREYISKFDLLYPLEVVTGLISWEINRGSILAIEG